MVEVLEGGLNAWIEAGYPVEALALEAPPMADAAAPVIASAAQAKAQAAAPRSAYAESFLPGLVGTYLTEQSLPVRKELTFLFVDLADSTAAILRYTAEEALALVQDFMRVVTQIALEYCGDVKDYEGDGALLYFESVTEAAQAVLAIRTALAPEQQQFAAPLRARISLNVGDIIVGIIGSELRRSVALIGPSLNLASRLLKEISPGGIIATAATVERLTDEAPKLAAQFTLFKENLTLKGFDDELVTAYHIP